jgi:EAL domain-containing protein (putative c-di-GMP-specific phosphodiesterase class I)
MAEINDVANALRRAVSRNEISAWFQPQIDLHSERLVAAEALCRWTHPTWGAMRPDEFIPIAEETGTIAEIGEYMATQAISAMREWNIDVSVNVSPAQLDDSIFTTWLERMLSPIRSTERRLTVEITEGRHIDDVPALVTRLDRLRHLGTGIAIDDYGAGQASFTQVRRLHATELKIDRSLVSDESSAASELIVDAVTLAREAGIRVVAEGIETPDQLERVARMGCDRAQGYLLGRPMPRAQLTQLLAA